jgi:hypothetical protein
MLTRHCRQMLAHRLTIESALALARLDSVLPTRHCRLRPGAGHRPGADSVLATDATLCPIADAPTLVLRPLPRHHLPPPPASL